MDTSYEVKKKKIKGGKNILNLHTVCQLRLMQTSQQEKKEKHSLFP